eukprot:PITA_01053
MEPKDIRLYMTLEKRSFVYRAYACAHFFLIIALIYYRLMYIPSDNYWPWILIFFAELGFGYSWILEQAFKWWPVERKVFTKILSQRFESDLPPVDIFICTADPIKEPPLTVINTVLSALALDYPVGKLSCYVSDDGGSPITFYALLEASRFAKIWIPFCDNYAIEDRCPEVYFSNADAIENKNMQFMRHRKHVNEMYLELKNRIYKAVEMGSVPADKQKKHKGFKDWVSGFTRRDHASIVQSLLEKTEDKDIEGNDLPGLIYVSREKRPGIPHHFKAGALNVLVRVSGVLSNAPFILTLDCDMYANNREALRQAMCFFLDPKTGHQFAYVQFPQTFHGITKNDLYSSQLKNIFQVQPTQAQDAFFVGMPYAEVGMIYGCAVEDAVTGFVIQCRGWKSIYCNPKRKAFLGCAPNNLIDTLIQQKRWAVGFLEFLVISGYGYSLIEFIWIGGSFKSWWNEQRMWLIKGVSAYLYALMEVAGKMFGVSEVGFQVTSKVVDSEAVKRYEAEILEFGVTSALFIPPATLAVINLISLVGGLAGILREGYSTFDSMVLQLLLCSYIVVSGYPILEAMFMRKDKGRIPTSVTIVSTLLAIISCSFASTAISSR